MLFKFSIKAMKIGPRNKWRKLFIKARQIAWHLRTDSLTATQHLSTARLSIELFSQLLSQSRHLSIAGGLIKKSPISLTAPRQFLDSCICRTLKLNTSRLIEVTKIKIFRSDFWARLLYLCRVSFLTTLDLYKTYFRGRHIREYKENECKRWPMSYSLWKKLLRLCALGFCNQVLLDLHCWWSEELCS